MAVSEFVIEVGDADFESQVIERSKEVPVLVDFWAPWCGPCRTLTPTLEALAEEGKGAWILAKINTDEHQAVAGRFGIRGIPNVKAFVDGEVVDEFSGAIPRHLVEGFLARVMPSEMDKAVDEARQALDEGDIATARAIYEAALEEDPERPDSIVGLALVCVHEGNVDAAGELLGTIDSITEKLVAAEYGEAWLALEAAKSPPESDSRAALDANPKDLDALYGIAVKAGAAGDFEQALATFLEILKIDRSYRDDVGRVGMVRIFSVLGTDDPLADHWRAQLGRWMY